MSLIKTLIIICAVVALLFSIASAPSQAFAFAKELANTLIDIFKTLLNHLPKLGQTLTEWIKTINQKIQGEKND